MPYSTNINSDRSQSLIRLEGAQAMKLVKKKCRRVNAPSIDAELLRPLRGVKRVGRFSFLFVVGTEGVFPETLR